MRHSTPCFVIGVTVRQTAAWPLSSGCHAGPPLRPSPPTASWAAHVEGLLTAQTRNNMMIQHLASHPFHPNVGTAKTEQLETDLATSRWRRGPATLCLL
jgi:hypothetical protein